jgi:hypothetical protein
MWAQLSLAATVKEEQTGLLPLLMLSVKGITLWQASYLAF